MSFGLPQKTISQLKTVFKKYPEITQVKIYGSRAKKLYRRGSDIDLAVFFNVKKDLLSNLSWDLDDLPSPYMFDLVNYNTLNDSPLKEEVDKYGKVFYKRSKKVFFRKKEINFKLKKKDFQKKLLFPKSPSSQKNLSSSKNPSSQKNLSSSKNLSFPRRRKSLQSKKENSNSIQRAKDKVFF